METETAQTVVTTVSQLSETGTIGVIFLLIILLAGAFYLLYKFAANHVEHANEAFNKNTEALTGLTKVIEYKIQ